MKLVFILLDACKSKYVTENNMPYIYDMTKKGKYISKIFPSSGFCERSEIFTGLDCYESGNFTAIGYCPEKGEYPARGVIITLANALSKVYKRGAKYILRKYREKKKISMQPYYIPPKSLFQYGLTEDSKERLFNYRTIMDELDENGYTYSLQGFTSLAQTINMKIDLISFVDKMTNENIDFIPIYLGEIDVVGHKNGKEIEKIIPYLQEVDLCVKKISEIAKGRNYAVAVLGDHGMVPVIETVNIFDVLKEIKIDERQYTVFLDSTMARFWFKNIDAREKVCDALKNHLRDKGIIIDETNYAQYKIPLDVCAQSGKPIYGEIIWCANPGILIWPDYFNNPKMIDKGMHGYICTDVEEGTGFFVSSIGSEKVESSDLKDICKELCLILNCKEPNLNWSRKNE